MKRPFLNLLSLLSGDLGSRLIGFFVSVYLARVLEPAGFGLMSVGLSVLGYLQLAGSPGIQVLETRNAAALAGVDRIRVSAVLSLRLLLAAALGVLTACSALLLFPHSGAGHVIVLFALSVFPFALTLDWFFQGREEFLSVGTARMLQFGAYGVMVLLLVHGFPVRPAERQARRRQSDRGRSVRTRASTRSPSPFRAYHRSRFQRPA